MSDATWKIQVSPKLPDGTLLNFRADTKDEADGLLMWATTNAQSLVEAVSAIQAAYNVARPGAQPTPPASAGHGVTQSPPPQQQPQAQPTPQQGGQPPAPSCQHGPKVYREGQGAKGKWRAYFCPAPKGDPTQCAPDWLKG